jgi:hypothetical protein
MEVKVYKFIVRTKIPYHVPAKYSSNTFTQLYIDGEFKGEYQNSAYGGFRKLIELLKKKYNFTEYIKKDIGSENRDY